MFPVAEVSSVDGRCRIGIPRYTTIPLLLYDVILNILLTLVFVYLLSPLIRSGTLSAKKFPASRLTTCLSNICGRLNPSNNLIEINRCNQLVVKKIERLLLRTFIGSILVMLPTVGNMTALSALRGRELGWVCLVACSFDSLFTAFDC